MVATRLLNTVDVTGKSRVTGLVAIGDSITLGSAAASGSYFENFLARTGQVWRRMGNFAVAGKRTDEILAAQVPSAISSGASHCVVQSGTNDISQSVTEATLRANKTSIYTTLRAGGVEPIVVSIFPNNAGNAVRHVAHAIWEKMYCNKNHIRFVDAFGALAAFDGTYAAGLNFDTIHPNALGANVAADILATALASNSGQWSPLCALTDSAADASGQFVSHALSFPSEIGADIGAVGAGGTYTTTAVDSGGVGKWLRTTISGGTLVGWESRVGNTTTLGWANGDKVATGCFIRCSADPAMALTVFAQYARSTMPTTSLQGSGFLPGSTSQVIALYDENVFTSGSQISIKFFASGTGWFEVNRPICVNLTQLGL